MLRVVCILTYLLLSNMLDYFIVYVFFFNDTATTEIYTLSLHDALPIYSRLVYFWLPRINVAEVFLRDFRGLPVAACLQSLL